jgi:hypothetical protein
MSDLTTQAERALREKEHPFDATEEAPLEPDLPPDRTRTFTYTNFSRMRTGWLGDDAVMLGEINATADRIIKGHFKVAFDLIDKIYLCVREAEADGNGEVRVGPDGRPVWQLDEQGNPVEDWTRLGDREREAFLFTLTTHMFDFERARVRAWREAMFSKAQWEEKFALGFRSLNGAAITGKPTVDDRAQAGTSASMQERYFAIFCSAVSKEADGIIRALYALQRLLEKTTTS